MAARKMKTPIITFKTTVTTSHPKSSQRVNPETALIISGKRSVHVTVAPSETPIDGASVLNIFVMGSRMYTKAINPPKILDRKSLGAPAMLNNASGSFQSTFCKPAHVPKRCVHEAAPVQKFFTSKSPV